MCCMRTMSLQAGRLAATSGSLLQGKVSAELVGEAVLSAAARSGTGPRRQPQLMAVMDDIQVRTLQVASY